jgi:hypothetical protein
LPSARSVLKRSKTPLTCKEIVERAVSEGLLKSQGKTPAKTLYAALSRHMKRRGSNSDFRKLTDKTFVLAKKS